VESEGKPEAILAAPLLVMTVEQERNFIVELLKADDPTKNEIPSSRRERAHSVWLMLSLYSSKHRSTRSSILSSNKSANAWLELIRWYPPTNDRIRRKNDSRMIKRNESTPAKFMIKDNLSGWDNVGPATPPRELLWIRARF
jgi:hypothetical protein